MGLYRDRSITDVVSKPDLVLHSQEDNSLAASAIARARLRLSDDPLRERFTLTAITGLSRKTRMISGTVCACLRLIARFFAHRIRLSWQNILSI